MATQQKTKASPATHEVLNRAILRRRRNIRNALIALTLVFLGVSFMPLLPMLMGRGGAVEFVLTVLFFSALLAVLAFSQRLSVILEYLLRYALVDDAEYEQLRRHQQQKRKK